MTLAGHSLRTRQIAECLEPDDVTNQLCSQGQHEQALARRRQLAQRLYQAWQRGDLPDPDYGGELTHYLPLLWVHSLWPGACLTQDQWAEMFDDAGYSIDGDPADPPEDTEATWPLYRGVATQGGQPTWMFPDRRDIPTAERGWCWTPDRNGAARWAKQHARSQGVRGWAVYQATVDCHAVLATLDFNRSTLAIVDTRELTDPPCRAQTGTVGR